MKKNSQFEEFITQNGLLNTTLTIWVVFLMHTYTRILWRVSPTAQEFESLLQVIESFALGLVTFLIIRRARHTAVKILFAIYEFLAVLLYYTPGMQGYLTYYLATLCASSIFGLGYISTQSYKERKEEEGKEEAQVNSEILRLTQLLEQVNSELLSSQSEVKRSNSEVNQREQEVSNLQNRVSELQKAVTILSNGVTEREARLQQEINEAMAQIDAQTKYFNSYKVQASEWERVYIAHQQANESRRQKMQKQPPTN